MPTGETIYDITAIPFFPYIPGIVAWGGLIAIALIGIAGTRWYLERRPHRVKLKALELLQGELGSIIGQIEQRGSATKTDLARISLLMRRFLSVMSGRELMSAGPKELEQKARETRDSNLKELLGTLSLIDDTRYQPEGSALPGRQVLKGLEEALIRYWSEFVETKS